MLGNLLDDVILLIVVVSSLCVQEIQTAAATPYQSVGLAAGELERAS